MLRTDLVDHRGTKDAALLRALANADAIALAEAYHRTIAGAHACARRLLASPVEVEALLRAVYADLWAEPPIDGALEGWVRSRCFSLGAGYLRQQQLPAPSPSLAAYTPGVRTSSHVPDGDALESLLADLGDQQHAALVRAHDQGIRTSDQEDPEAGWALLHALLILASPLSDDERHAAEMCTSGVALANWILGLLPPHEASTVPGTAAEPTACGRLASVLRRARRRFEPLPPTPDLGHRVLASVLAAGAQRYSAAATRAFESDLRVEYTNVDRLPRAGDREELSSSLDMAPPTDPAEHRPRPSGRAEAPLSAADVRTRAGVSAAQALPAAPPFTAPHSPPAPDEPASEELVRLPLRRHGRPTGPVEQPRAREQDRPDLVTDDTSPMRLEPLEEPPPRPAGDQPSRTGAEREEPAPSPLQHDETMPVARRREDGGEHLFDQDELARSPLRREVPGGVGGARPPVRRERGDPGLADVLGPAAAEPAGSPLRQPAPPPHPGAMASQPGAPGPGRRPGPIPDGGPDAEEKSGSRVLRWLVIILLIALGAAFGLSVGLQLIS